MGTSSALSCRRPHFGPHLIDRNVRPPLVYRTAQDERALSMVGAGVGITVMPDSYTAPDVVRVPMRDFNPRRTVALFLPRFALSDRVAGTGGTFKRFTAAFFRIGHAG